jgi:hypothetical protein
VGPKPWPLEARDKIAAPNLTLLYVSRQVHNEALTVGWSGPKRCFIDNLVFTAVADSKVGIAHNFKVLNKIQLDFTAKSWLKFFGLEIDPIFHEDESASFGRYLAGLGDQATLEIRFRDPDDGIGGDSWGLASGWTSCQTVIIDWILTFAFQHVKHVKYINLSGHSKKPQKEKWFGVFCSPAPEERLRLRLRHYRLGYLGHALNKIVSSTFLGPRKPEKQSAYEGR